MNSDSAPTSHALDALRRRRITHVPHVSIAVSIVTSPQAEAAGISLVMQAGSSVQVGSSQSASVSQLLSTVSVQFSAAPGLIAACVSSQTPPHVPQTPPGRFDETPRTQFPSPLGLDVSTAQRDNPPCQREQLPAGCSGLPNHKQQGSVAPEWQVDSFRRHKGNRGNEWRVAAF